MTPLLRVEGLRARYRGFERPIVADLSWQQEAGEIVVLRGRNGSGKSTILRRLAGDPRIEGGGEARFRDQVPRSVRAWRALGVRWVPQIGGSFETLSVSENLELAARSESTDTIAAALDLFPSLKPLLRRQVRHLSGGEKKMVDLAVLAFVASPAMLWLDEPLASLSPQNAQRFLVHLEHRVSSGTAVVVALHRSLPESFKVQEIRMGD